MLDTAFERPPGDVGNPASWRFPVLFGRVTGATARRVVGGHAVLDDFVAEAHRLADQGAIGLLTSCGFLAALQPELAARCPVPVASSALLQIPMLRALTADCIRPTPRRADAIRHSRQGSDTIGVITYDATALTPQHFTAVGADTATPVVGLPPGGAWHRMIEGGETYDAPALQREVVEAALALHAANPGLAAIVLECTNLPPFAPAIRDATGLPVYDVITLGHWFHAGLIA
jgi:hypothetical protein